MFRRAGQRPWWIILLVGFPVLPGCLFPDCPIPDGVGGPPATQPLDLNAAVQLAPAPPPPPPAETLPPPRPVQDRLQIPPELPGASASPLPPMPEMKGRSLEERRAIVRKLFPATEPLGEDVEPALPREGQPWTLADLQALAAARSPVLRRAAADVEAARGAAVQAGLPPNPTAGYQADQVQPGPGPKHNAGQQGGFLQQTIKLWDKLRLAQAAAAVDLVNAEVALRRAQVDLASQVRAGYFAVLVARENVFVSRAVVRLTEAAYRVQLAQVVAGEAAAYEPVQLYVQAVQARNALVQARNRYLSAWKQLAATLAAPGLPPTQLAGRADAAVPLFRYDEAVARVLSSHTDVLTAENTILRARYHLRLQEVTPLPDVITNTVLQHDNAAGNHQFGLQIGLPLPVFDRNQGNIQQARAQVARAVEDLEATRNDLAGRLAEAFERYESNRVVLVNFRDKILPNQVRAYRLLRRRYEGEPARVGFADIITAQQTLVGQLTSYLSTLSDQWTAVVNVATLLQVDDLYGQGPDGCAPVQPVADQLLHLCSPPPAAEGAGSQPLPVIQMRPARRGWQRADEGP